MAGFNPQSLRRAMPHLSGKILGTNLFPTPSPRSQIQAPQTAQTHGQFDGNI
jgi:hypothetical protein